MARSCFDASCHQVSLGQFQVAMMVIYLKSMSSFQRSFGRAWRYHEGGSEERSAVCCSTGTWAGGGRDFGWVLPSLNALTERCFIGQ